MELDLPGEVSLPLLQQLADLASALCGGAQAEINAITREEQINLATSRGDRDRVPREHSLCGRVLASEDDFVHVPDALEGPRLADSPFVSGELGTIRSYAAATVQGPSGAVLGTICVFRHDHGGGFDQEQLAALERLSPLVSEALAQHQRQTRLRAALDRLVWPEAGS